MPVSSDVTAGIQTIEFEGEKYPFYQTEGFAAQFAFPFAKKVCRGVGFDIGCMKKEWSLPGSIPIDKILEDDWEAMNLPPFMVDFIYSSHALEHIPDWVRVLDYWTSRIKEGGVLFLYLPHPSQRYWLPWNNKKHLHIFYPEMIKDYMVSNGYYKVYSSERDLYNSFMIMGEKK